MISSSPPFNAACVQFEPDSGVAFAALRSEPWRPTGGNLVHISDLHRPSKWRASLTQAGALPFSQPPTPKGRAPAGNSTIMRLLPFQ